MVKLSNEAPAKFQKILDDAVSQGLPGVVAGVTNGQEVLWTGASGKRELGSNEDMSTKNVFWIASCTKMITGIAAMQLVEQGKLSLDEPIDKIVPELANPQIIENGKLRPAQNKITLLYLLTHTAGFSYSFFNDDIKKIWQDSGADEFGGDLKGLLTPLVGEPGTLFRYGTNIDVAGLMVERVSGLKLGDYFKKHIFDPIGADDLAFEVGDRANRLAGMHQRSPDGKVTNRKHFPIAYKKPDFHSGGGGLFGSVESYLKVIQVLLNKGKGANGAQILKPETVATMFEDHVPAKAAQDLHLPIPDARPDLTVRLESLTAVQPGAKIGWGLTFLVNKEELQLVHRPAGTAQWAGLANLFWTADPSTGLGMFIMSQILPFGDAATGGAFVGIEKMMYEEAR